MVRRLLLGGAGLGVLALITKSPPTPSAVGAYQTLVIYIRAQGHHEMPSLRSLLSVLLFWVLCLL
ncbi:MAG: hypothetical protein IPK53_03355 [bacterium]|nr:hypothetical protein [bacterium]